jgi:glycosyltransferase involved in cell wall biosynthesis
VVSLICPVFNEERYIRCCVDSIIEQDYPKNDMEVLFVDGNSTDNTVLILREYKDRMPYIRIIKNPERITPISMNVGIRESKGNIIIRVDAHARYPFNYVTALVKKLNDLDADNVGAVVRTDVLKKNEKTLAICEVLSNPFGVGNSYFRIGINETKKVDTVPFGCWKRDVFNRFGYFDSRLARNQDLEFNKRIGLGGGRIFIVPDTYSTYFARETFKEIAKNSYLNGKWNILTIYYTRNIHSISLRHFIPLLFLLSLIIPIPFMLFYIDILYISIVSLSAYLILLLFISLPLAIKKKFNILYLIVSFVVLHLSHGLGSLSGIIRILNFTKKTII